MPFDDFDIRHQETLELIGRKETQATPVEQNFMEKSGALDVMTPDQVAVNPQNLKRSVERAMRMSPNPNAQKAVQERGFPVPDQVDLGGGTVPVPPAAPKMTGETLSFVRGVNDGPGSFEGILARKVNKGELTLDEALKKQKDGKGAGGGRGALGSGSSEADFRSYLSLANSNALKMMKFNDPNQMALMMEISKNPESADRLFSVLERSMTPEQREQYQAAVDSYINTYAPDDVVQAYAARTARPGAAAPEQEAAPDPETDPLDYLRRRRRGK